MRNPTQIAQGDFARARAYRAFERAVWHECVNERAIERFGGTAQGLELNRPALFRGFEGRDAWRPNAQTAGILYAAHPERITDGAYPSLGRRAEALRRLQGSQAVIKALPSAFAGFCFHSTA